MLVFDQGPPLHASGGTGVVLYLRLYIMELCDRASPTRIL